MSKEINMSEIIDHTYIWTCPKCGEENCRVYETTIDICEFICLIPECNAIITKTMPMKNIHSGHEWLDWEYKDG